MRLTHWLAGVAQKQSHSRRSTRRGRRTDVAPALELLEDRTLLAASLGLLNGTNGFRLDGVAAGDLSGRSVSGLGDINGDGYDDVIIGAPMVSGGRGESYVVYGKPTGFSSSINLSSLNGVNGFRVQGIDPDDMSGNLVSGAGDVNGDGLADILIAATQGDPRGRVDAGESYVIYGKTTSFGPVISAASLSGSNGFRVDGAAAGDWAMGVRMIGDLDGDGYSEMGAVAPMADPDGLISRANAGEVTILYGPRSINTASFDLGDIPGGNASVLRGVDSSEIGIVGAGSVGDINGDGLVDIAIAAPLANSEAGEVYIVYGSESRLPPKLDLDELDGTNGFRIYGTEEGYDNVGISLTGLGDFNGDGFSDMAIVASYGQLVGQTYVLFGRSQGFSSSFSAASIPWNNGFRIVGIDDGDLLKTVSGIGDVNGDGFDDLALAAVAADPGNRTDAGEVYIVFGRPYSPASTYYLSDLSSDEGFQLDGRAAGDGAGWSVSSAGDMNGDGFGDFIIGALMADADGKADAGESYVVFGADFLSTVTDTGTSGQDVLTGTADDETLIGGRGDDTIRGEGGADVLNGAQGDDVLVVTDSSFRRIIGGTGIDTLRIEGDGTSLDLTALADNRIQSIELIDLSAPGTQTIAATRLDLQRLKNPLIIDGTDEDGLLITSGWSITGTEQIDSVTYHVLENGNTVCKVNATIAIAVALEEEETAVEIVEQAGVIEVRNGSQVFFAHHAASPLKLAVVATGTNVSVVVDDSSAEMFARVTLAVASANIDSTGDQLVLTGTSSASVDQEIGVLDSGTIPSVKLSFNHDLENPEFHFFGFETFRDETSASHRLFSMPEIETDVSVVLEDDGVPTDGYSRVSIDQGWFNVEFSNPVESLEMTTGSGNDTVLVGTPDGAFSASVTVDTGTGDDFLTGGSMSETLNGGEGNDTIVGSGGSDSITGGDGADRLNGQAGDDTLEGGDGQDTLNGGSGADLLSGGLGDDLLLGKGSSGDRLSGGPGDDTLDGGAGYDRISETADVDFTVTDSTLTGLGNDTLINIQLAQLFGGSSANTIDASAFTGRAFLNGLGGHDSLTGGSGYDRLFGGSGRDLIIGGDSNDVLRGQGGNYDTLIGGAGNDKLNGGIGHDDLSGGDGDDQLTGESGNDTLEGGEGTDRLYERGDVDLTLTDGSLGGGLGSNTVSGIETAYLKGGNGDNLFDATGFSGDVTLIGVGGADTLKGGSGNDMINGRAGDDLITGGDGDDTLKGMRDADTLNGGAGDDWLDGGTQDDRLSGWTGDDEMYGRSGNDTLVGGEGNDSLYGAADNDLLQGDDGKTDTLHERDDDRLDGGDGTDTVRGGGGADTMLDDASEIDANFAYWAEWVDAV